MLSELLFLKAVQIYKLFQKYLYTSRVYIYSVDLKSTKFGVFFMTDDPKSAINKLKETAEGKKEDKKEVKKEMTHEDKKDAKDAKHDKDAKVVELTNDLKRVQADFENYKKRCEKESHQFREYANAEFVKKLLPVLDSFELALANTKNHDDFVKGVEMIYSQLYSTLKEIGLDCINCKGGKFDPYLHEVLLSEKSDHAEDTVLEEFQKGYKFKNYVLRHSKVKVAKK